MYTYSYDTSYCSSIKRFKFHLWAIPNWTQWYKSVCLVLERHYELGMLCTYCGMRFVPVIHRSIRRDIRHYTDLLTRSHWQDKTCMTLVFSRDPCKVVVRSMCWVVWKPQGTIYSLPESFFLSCFEIFESWNTTLSSAVDLAILPLPNFHEDIYKQAAGRFGQKRYSLRVKCPHNTGKWSHMSRKGVILRKRQGWIAANANYAQPCQFLFFNSEKQTLKSLKILAVPGTNSNGVRLYLSQGDENRIPMLQ